MNPLANLEAWHDDRSLFVASTVVTMPCGSGAPDTETERVELIADFVDQLRTVDIATVHLRFIREHWCATPHLTAAIHRDGMVAIRHEEYELTKARHLYQRALLVLRSTVERKVARAALVDAACAYVDAIGEDAFDRYDNLEALVAAWRKFDEVPA